MALKHTCLLTLTIGIWCDGCGWIRACIIWEIRQQSSYRIIFVKLLINVLCKMCRSFIHSQNYESKQIQLHFMRSLSTWLKSIYEKVTARTRIQNFLLYPHAHSHFTGIDLLRSSNTKKNTRNSCEKSSCVKSVKQRTCYASLSRRSRIDTELSENAKKITPR